VLAQSLPESSIDLPHPPAIQAAAAILMDAETGQVLYARNPDVPRPPASTTKIMTAILLLENTQPTDILTASKRASDTGGSSLNLREGEKITAHDMLYALMLRSANDGCVAVAEHIAGSERKFAEMMTRKAKEIGAANTIFRNCNGLNENPNRTTARDLAMMARYASRYPAFNDAVHTKACTITRAAGDRDTLLINHAKFLWHFPGADGVKTGYTNPAGHCFVGAATWNGWRLISVVLHSPDIVRETSALMKYGFEHFHALDVVRAGQEIGTVPVHLGRRSTVTARAQSAVRYIVPNGESPNVELRPRFLPVGAPLAAGAPVGALEVWIDGRQVGSAPLIAETSVERVAAAAPNRGSWWIFIMVLLGTVVIGNGTAIAQAARRGRCRLAAILRGPDSRG